MKKVLFTLSLLVGACVAQAQTPIVTITNSSSYPSMGAYVTANDASIPSCAINGGAGLFGISTAPGGSTIDITSIISSAWAPPTPSGSGTNMVECHLDLEVSPGVHIGAPPISFCGSGGIGLPIVFGGTVTLTVDIRNVGGSWTIDVY
jgi:hypothetical protein